MTQPDTDYFSSTQGLLDAVKVAGLNGTSDPSAALDPPSVVIGPPQLEWEAIAMAPTKARHEVYACVPTNEYAIPALSTFLPQVVDALHEYSDAVVLTATPTVWSAAGNSFPAYAITVEVSL